MPKKSEPLTPDELDEIARRREAARARAQSLIETADPAEDAVVIAAAEADPDALPMSDAELARLHPAHEVNPSLVVAQLRRGRGRPRVAAPKKQVTLRVDADVADRLRASGRGWQTRVNAVLKAWLDRSTG